MYGVERSEILDRKYVRYRTDSIAARRDPEQNESTGAVMYNVDLVRKLCGDIYEAENDSERELQLIYLLEAAMNDDHEKARIRTALLNERQNAVC